MNSEMAPYPGRFVSQLNVFVLGGSLHKNNISYSLLGLRILQ